MSRKHVLIAAAVLVAVAACAAVFFSRPVSIQDGEGFTQVRPFAWSVGQALAFAGVSLDPHDQVIPALDQPIPLNGKIMLERAVLAAVWDGGQMQPISGLRHTPRELLNQAGIHLNEGDRLLWNGEDLPLDSQLPTGAPLVLQIVRAVPVLLDLDGNQQEILSTAPTVSRVLWEAGVRIGPGDWLSLDAGALIEPGITIQYRSAVPLTIQAAGRELQSRSSAKTVGAALAEAGVALQGLDYSQPGEDQPLPADGRIRVVRVREEILLTETLVPFDSQFAPDPELELDLQRTNQAGQYGVQVTRERVRYEDGQEVSRSIDSDWTAANPVPQTIGYGTKVVTRSEETAGGTIEYWRKIRVRATSYSPCRLGTGDNRCSYITASGARLTKGIVAVSLKWFREMRGQQVYIPGYGFGVIGDYGALPGMWIDLGFDEENFEQGAIVGYVDMYFLTPVPPNIPWTLP